MQIITREVPDDFNLFLFGDVHTGSLMSYDSGWEKLVDIMTSKYDGLPASKNFGVDHGDMIEAITIDDKRFEEATTKESSILAQIETATRMRTTIQEKLICLLKGNHEHAVIRWGDAAKDIAKRLSVPCGTYSAVISYVDKKGSVLFKHYATHGRKVFNSTADDPVRRRSNMELSLKRSLKDMFGDTLLNSCGHAHKIISLKPRGQLYLTVGKKEIKHSYTQPKKKHGYIEPNHKWYACAGSFMRLFVIGVDGYAERAGYTPNELGIVIVKVRDREIVDMVEVPL